MKTPFLRIFFWRLCFCLMLPLPLCAAESPVWTAAVAEVREGLRQAKQLVAEKPSSADAAWKLGRAFFDAAELTQTKRERADLAEEGIAICRRAVDLQSNSAPAHYYWGLNIGQLARTKGFGALRLVGQMRDQFQDALRLDEGFDYAGSHRNLGYLYRDAPSWGSIGDKNKARYHLQRAVELAPGYPENRLALIEGLVQWKEKALAETQLRALEELWLKAKERLTGPVWEVTWADWQAQLDHLRQKLRK